MNIRCYACGKDIHKTAKICKHCTSSQNKIIYWIDAYAPLGTLIISLLSLVISSAAFYFSRVKEPPGPELVVQIDRFSENSFSVLVTNVGELPTVVRNLDLIVTLQQREGQHAVRAGFSVSPTQISKGEGQLFDLAYSDFVPRHTRWTTSEDATEAFSLRFLNLAASLGNNLHCEVEVYFTSRRYFPSNAEGADGSVNGACVEAMAWFANNIGPLRVKEISGEEASDIER